MASPSGCPMKELFRLIRDVDKLTDGQANIIFHDEDENEDGVDTLTFHLDIKPNDGFYKGGKCKFKVVVEESYPSSPPAVTCLNAIYHPNIDFLDEYDDSGGNVCVNLLSNDWTPEVGLDGCVMAILFLFYNPQLDDSLNPAFSGSDVDLDEFAENVKMSMLGEEIDGYSFDRIIEGNGDDVNQTEEVALGKEKDKVELDENLGNEKDKVELDDNVGSEKDQVELDDNLGSEKDKVELDENIGSENDKVGLDDNLENKNDKIELDVNSGNENDKVELGGNECSDVHEVELYENWNNEKDKRELDENGSSCNNSQIKTESDFPADAKTENQDSIIIKLPSFIEKIKAKLNLFSRCYRWMSIKCVLPSPNR